MAFNIILTEEKSDVHKCDMISYIYIVQLYVHMHFFRTLLHTSIESNEFQCKFYIL